MNRGQLVSIIVTTRNEQDVIKKLLISVVRQTYQNIEIIVVDNNSSDKTREIAKRFTKKIFNFGPERSAQRNFGAKVAKGEYLLFIDADMELSKDVVKECVELIEVNQKVGAISIKEESIANTFWEKIKAFERSFYNLEGDPATDAARFFSKKIFNKVGGYDESITGPEDWDLSDTIRKLEVKIGRISAIITHRERVSSLFDLAKKKFYYALRLHRYLEKQKVSVVSSKTIYFLRPVFYKNPAKLISHPILTLGMFIMLSFELFAGGLGYLLGRFKKL